jgi:hypothetical protein
MARGWKPIKSRRWTYRRPQGRKQTVTFPHPVTEREARKGARAMLTGRVDGALPRGTRVERA